MSSKEIAVKRRKRTELVLAGFLVGSLMGCDRTTDAEFVAKAKEFQNAGNLQGTAIELKNALEKNPDNPEARRLLGLVMLKMGNAPAAEKELTRAMELKVAREALLLPMAEALLLQGKNQELLDLDEAPESMPPADRATFRAYRGDAWLGLNKPDAAKAEYDEALALDKSSPQAKTGLARLATARRDYGEAHRLLLEALEAAPDDGRLWRLQAQLFQAEGKLAEAESSYSKAIEKNHFNYIDRAQRAIVRINLKKTAEASADVDELKKTDPNLFLTHYAAGLLDYSENRLTEALAHLTEANRLDEQDGATLFFLGATHYGLGHLEQADQILSRYLAADPGSARGTSMLAMVKFAERDFTRARELLAPVVRQFPNNVMALALMGQIEFALGNGKQGLEYFENAVKLMPTAPDLLTQLAAAYLATGEEKKGLETLKIVGNLKSDYLPAELLATMSFIQSKQWDKAQESVAKMKERMKDNPMPANLMGIIQQRRGNTAEARKSFEEAAKLQPAWAAPVINLTQIDLSEKDYAAARGTLEAAIKANPKDLSLQLQLARIDASENKPGAMEERLSALMAAHPEALEPRLILARYYARFGQPRRALSLLEDARRRHGNQAEVLAVLTEAELAAGQTAEAIETASNLVKQAPSLPYTHRLLGRAYANHQDYESAQKAFKKALELDPKFLPARLDLVRLEASTGKLEAAQKQLAELAKAYPENGDVMEVEGWLAMQLRKWDDAAKVYGKIMKTQPSSSGARDLAQAHWLNGEKATAVEVLENWVKSNDKDIEARYVLSLYYREQGNPSATEGQLEKILDINPNQPLALNDLAWELRDKAPERALELAEKAARLAPKQPLVLDTLGMVLLRNHQGERAVAMLEQASSLDPGNRLFKYHWALAQSETGSAREALTKLESLLSDSTPFPERTEAENLLKRLQQGSRP